MSPQSPASLFFETRPGRGAGARRVPSGRGAQRLVVADAVVDSSLSSGGLSTGRFVVRTGGSVSTDLFLFLKEITYLGAQLRPKSASRAGRS